MFGVLKRVCTFGACIISSWNLNPKILQVRIFKFQLHKPPFIHLKKVLYQTGRSKASRM